MDTLTREQRHYVMSRVRAKNTSPEREIRGALHRGGFRFRVCDRRYFGSPDIALPKYYAVIFINGCFWHAHKNCAAFRIPKINKSYWLKKFRRNKERDRRTIAFYKEKCWRVCVVWECAINGKNKKRKVADVADRIMLWLDEPDDPFLEIRGESSGNKYVKKKTM